MPRIVDQQQRRQEIVFAMWQLIARRGIEGVTLRAVAAEAGVSMGRVQHYFSSREQLVLDGCRMMVDGGHTEYVRAGAELAPWERLRLLILRTIPQTPGFRLGTIVWSAYIAKAVDSPAIAELVRDAHRGAVEEAAGLVEAGQADGVIQAEIDPRRTGRRLLATAEGYAVRVVAGSLDAVEAVADLECELRTLRC